MKQFCITLLIAMAFTASTAQAFVPERMHPTDRFIITVFSDIWQEVPETMDIRTFQRGISISALQDMPLGRTNLSLAAGLAFSSHNLYSDNRYRFIPSLNQFRFVPIDPDHDYDNNKLSLNYLEVPVQLRFRTRDLPSTLRFYAGIKAGYLFHAHTKFVGKEYYPQHFDPNPMVMERTIKVKEHKLNNINKYRIGLSGTIGYGAVNLHVYYQLTETFKDNNAEGMYPWSVGVTFIVF